MPSPPVAEIVRSETLILRLPDERERPYRHSLWIG